MLRRLVPHKEARKVGAVAYLLWPLTNYEHMLIINAVRRDFVWQGQSIADELVLYPKAITSNQGVSHFLCWKKSF